MPEKSRKLYEKCWGCKGTRKTTIAFNVSSGRELPIGSPCPLCEDGFFDTGLTVGQCERQFTTLDLTLLALADLYGTVIEHSPGGVNVEMGQAMGQAADLMQKYAAKIMDARIRLGRPGWEPPFKPERPT